MAINVLFWGSVFSSNQSVLKVSSPHKGRSEKQSKIGKYNYLQLTW